MASLWPGSGIANLPSGNHALIDGNKRLALAGVIAFYGVNGRRLTLTNDEAYELVMAVAEGSLNAADDIAARLAKATEPRHQERAGTRPAFRSEGG
jgi:prophage maintenance system killer protein